MRQGYWTRAVSVKGRLSSGVSGMVTSGRILINDKKLVKLGC